MNTQSNLSLARLKRAKQSRYNPLPSIGDPAQLTRKLDAFEAGYFKEPINIFDSLEQRDDLVRSVVSKRKKAVGRQGWTVLIRESIPADRRAQAQAHADALEHFYQNLRCENALDRSERGGFKLLCRQMMDAIGKRFAVHEIVWRPASPTLNRNPNPNLLGSANVLVSPDSSSPLVVPSSDGSASAYSEYSVVQPSISSSVQNSALRAPTASSPHSAIGTPSVVNPLLTATFRFVPLSFFENTTGTLRFLEHESALEGISLDPGAWMITTGEGLMMATATAWMLKHIALTDWLLYAERNGRPIIRGTTAAAENSPEWQALEARLEDILNGNAVVHSSSDDVKVLDLAVGGNIPYPDLVDRIDRMIAALWRGADLSTMSRDRGYGASLQERETCALEEDDAELLTETLNEYVDKWVIRYLFGEDAQPLANVKVLVTPKECTTADIEIDQFLYKTGAPLGLHDLMTRYGRALPKPGEPFLQLPLNPNLNLNPNPPSSVISVPSVVKSFSKPSSHPESSHHASAHVPNSEDAPDCDSPVNSRDSSPLNLNPNLNPTPNLLGGTNVLANPDSAPPDANDRSSRREETEPHSEGRAASPRPPSSPKTNDCSSRGDETPSDFPPATNNEQLTTDENQIPVHSCPLVVSGLSNTFELIQRDWIQLSPYGDFPHVRGLQRVDLEAAEAMVKQFNGFRGRLGRLFGGAPFYVGHPDLPQTSELADRKAYGWIMQLEAREDGLYGFVKWSDAGLDLLKQAHYKYLSPYWEAKQIDAENGRPIFRPTALVSVGLTNQPNIPVKPLSNSEAVTPTHNLTPTLPGSANVPVSPDSPSPFVVPSLDGSVSAYSEYSVVNGDSSPVPPSAPSVVKNELASLTSLPPVQNSGIRVHSCPFVVSPSSVVRYPIPLHNMHTRSITENLGSRRGERFLQNTRSKIRQAIKSKIRLGQSYEDAWRDVKEEHHDWFANES